MNILELIQAALGKAGVDKKYAERVQKLFKIEKDENIDEFVALFKDNVLPAIVEAETAAKTAAEAATKAATITEYETTHKLKDGKPIEVEDPNQKKPEGAMTPEMKAMQDSINKLTETLTGVVKTSTNAQKLEMVKAKLKGLVDDKFIDKVAAKVNLDSENLDAEITAQVSEFTEFRQSLINEYIGDNYVQKDGKPAGEKTVEEWGKIMNNDGGIATTGVVDLGLGK